MQRWAVLVLVFSFALGLTPQGRLEGPYRVLRVVDGDTVELEGIGSVRLIGIDTPESSYNQRTSGLAEVILGLKAKDYVQKFLVPGVPAWLERDVQPRDRYGRTLGYLYIESPRGDWESQGRKLLQVNLEIARAGWADPLTIPPNVRYASAYVSAVQQARTAKLGMWSEATPATPSVSTPSTSAPSEYDCPKDRPIKGNIRKDGTRLYHVSGDSSYRQTKPEKCFATPQEAEANGFRPARPAR